MKPSANECIILPLPETMVWKSIKDIEVYRDEIMELMTDTVIPSWVDFTKNIACIYILVAVETNKVLGFFINWRWKDIDGIKKSILKHYSCCISIENAYIKPQMEIFMQLRIIY